MAAVCIRCGSREHSTRDHDEGNIPGGKAAPKKPPPKKAVEKPKDAPAAKLQHPVCWKNPTKKWKIPDIMDKPLPGRWTPPQDNIEVECYRHPFCPCLKCQKAKQKKELEALRRIGKA
jgi:hypothetical protein